MTNEDRAPQSGDSKMGITVQEYWSTVIAVFVMGALVGWALFGKPRQVDWILESESLANWVAAIGTWVVGYMAWRIGTTSHEQKLREYEDKVAAERKALRDRRNNTFGRISQLYNVISHHALIDKKVVFAPSDLGEIIAFSRQVIDEVDRAKWSAEEASDFAPADRAVLNAIQQSMNAMRFHAERFHAAPSAFGAVTAFQNAVRKPTKDLSQQLSEMWTRMVAMNGAATKTT